jgi:hypothetical protein
VATSSSFKRFAAFALGLLAGVAGPAAALDLNGYLPGDGKGHLAVSYTRESWDEFWLGETKVSDPGVGEATIRSLTAWFTWGLTDDLAIVANLPSVDADSDGLGGFNQDGLQDLSLLLKYRFASRESGAVAHRFVVAAGVRTPASSYDANLPIDVGDGTTDGLFRFIYQLERGRFYFSQQVGYDLRSEDAPDGFPLYTELGFTTGRVTWTAIYSRLFADGGTDIGDPGFTFPSNQEEYERVVAKAYVRFNARLGLSLYGFTTLDGRNSGDATGAAAGLVYTF